MLDTDKAENINGVVDANPEIATAADGAIAMKFDGTNSLASISSDILDIDMADVKEGTRTIVMNIKNTGDSDAVKPPVLTLITPKSEISASEEFTWILPGETKRVAYIIDYEFWNPSRLRNLKELRLDYEGKTAMIEISDIFLTERPTDK